MAKKARDRSLSGQWEAALRRRQVAEEALAQLENAEVVAAEKRVSRELQEIGVIAFAEAQTNQSFREILLAAASEGRSMARRKIVDIARKGPLVGHLQQLPGRLVPGEEKVTTKDHSSLPTIPTQDESDAATVVQYAHQKMAAMSSIDLHVTIMNLVGAIYIDDIYRWACTHPDFKGIMKSVERSIDQDVEGLQPDMVRRYDTVILLEKKLDSNNDISRTDALLEWENIATQDEWMPPERSVAYIFKSGVSDDERDSIAFDSIDEILEYQVRDDTFSSFKHWDGSWIRDGIIVTAHQITQDEVFNTWKRRIVEARARIDTNNSIGHERDLAYKKEQSRSEAAKMKEKVEREVKKRKSNHKVYG